MEQQALEFGLLRTFLAVAYHGSLRKTAAAIDKTQPAVSHQILRLEKIVGQRLFARTWRGVELTRHGDLLVDYAHRAVQLSEQTLLRLRSETVGGPVRLGISADVALAGLIPILKRFQHVHSEVELRVRVSSTDKLAELLTKGELDLVIGDPAFITGTPILGWQEPLVWARSAQLRVLPYQTLPLVLFESPCSWRDEILDSLRRAGRNWRVVFESASVDAILAAVRSGLGMSVLLASTIRNSQIVEAKGADLPQAPRISFGLFRGSGFCTTAQANVESLLAKAFRIRNRDCEVVADELAEHVTL
jgi:DNA-binding transcriptional LysR family regulator